MLWLLAQAFTRLRSYPHNLIPIMRAQGSVHVLACVQVGCLCVPGVVCVSPMAAAAYQRLWRARSGRRDGVTPIDTFRQGACAGLTPVSSRAPG